MRRKTMTRLAGVVHEHYEQNLHIHRLKDTRRDTVDAWLDMVYEVEVASSKATEPVLFLVDMRGHWITPYIIARVTHSVSRTPPGIVEWVAVLAGESLLARTVENIIRRFPASIQSTTRIFQKEDDAIAWLLEQRRKYEDNKSDT